MGYAAEVTRTVGFSTLVTDLMEVLGVDSWGDAYEAFEGATEGLTLVRMGSFGDSRADAPDDEFYVGAVRLTDEGTSSTTVVDLTSDEIDQLNTVAARLGLSDIDFDVIAGTLIT